MRDELSDRLVPSLTGRTWSHEEFFWSLVFAGSFGLIGFSPEQQNQMRNAINEAANKLRQSCCAGPDSPKIPNAIETATYVYQPRLQSLWASGSLELFGHQASNRNLTERLERRLLFYSFKFSSFNDRPRRKPPD